MLGNEMHGDKSVNWKMKDAKVDTGNPALGRKIIESGDAHQLR